MLKALELVGFKSFADKTRFDFPAGITVVVGPNGSGKSNVVDAIKWVLGEQSVKSLRGTEMADVIFNGSPTRRGMNAAEITLTFDNSKNLLAMETPEVHVTRRVYRSGEGEYLINRTPCRLRDIRDLLAGTGLGTQAYSVIEQGKVDVLLQASTKDRRMIFEEAAGISRFKQKKIEAQRRLERVEQNLLRLSDIVDEVDSRLRGVRAQAGKARRYKEHSDRLQELRTQVGQVEWRRLTARLEECEGRIRSLTDGRDGDVAAAESLEAGLLELETRVDDITENLRAAELVIAENRERIATQESTIEHERSRDRDLDDEIGRNRRQVVALSARADDLQQQVKDTGEAVRTAEELHRTIAQRLVEAERTLTELMDRLDHLRGENEQHRASQLEQLRTAATLGNEISRLESQVAAAEEVLGTSQGRIAELDGQLATLAAEIDALRRDRDELARSAAADLDRMNAAQKQLATDRKQLVARQDESAALRQRLSVIGDRIEILEELERRQEGLTAGVKEVLSRAASPSSGAFQAVQGLVADLFAVSVDVAPLVEAALGQAAQHVVASPSQELVDFLQENAQRFAGRVGFLWFDEKAEAPPAPPPIELENQPGVMGRADRFVEIQPRYAALAARLLGNTWIVDKLSHAIALSKSSGEGLCFVTMAGELVEADGTILVGPRQTSTGLISRRSQLRALHDESVESNVRLKQARTAAEELQTRIAQVEAESERYALAHRQTLEALAEQRLKLSASEERRSQFQQHRVELDRQLRPAAAQRDAAAARLSEVRGQRERFDARLSEMESRLGDCGQQIAQLEADRQIRNREATEIKVEMAKSEERLRNLHVRLRQFEEGRLERGRAIAESREQLEQSVVRADAARWNILRAESAMADLYLRKETLAREAVRLINLREALQHQRSQSIGEVQKIRESIRKTEESLHSHELAAHEVRHEREGLASRLREDYGIELAQLEHKPSNEEQREREEVQREIDELRQKLNSLGHVNLEALDELEALEARYKTLSDQFHDLTNAKGSLERIIEKINADSRRLFAETLQTVRGHFQKLFRDLFGGGHGDIVLDDGVDILESGIEIVARPPGKEPRSISLLSGGEKTLTCVALLLAMFRSRPSPFCVLDEVDAALDEANIDRFTRVLQDFLTWTQFIIVTHSKKTMTCASTIYGVTMQESGVSKQVSVRFEDVSDDGHISPSRLAEADKDTQAA